MAPVQKTQKCPKCHGYGRTKVCSKCHGHGEIIIAIDGKPYKKKPKKRKKAQGA